MNNYLPEVIYQKVKDDPDFKELDEQFNRLKYCDDDIAWFVVSDAVLNNDLTDRRLSGIVDRYCTEQEKLLFNIQRASTKEQLVKMIDSAISREALCFIYAELATFYEDDCNMWISNFMSVYSKEKVLNSKMHLEWFIFKCKLLRESIEYNEGMVGEYLEQMKCFAEEIHRLVPSDILHHIMVEEIAKLIPAIMDKVKDRSQIKLALDVETALPIFQYRDFSYGMMMLYDNLFELYFWLRDWDNAVRIAKKLVVYINDALDNKAQLIRGLNYYNSDFSLSFLIMLYKWNKIGYIVPNLSVKFYNLTENEKMAMTNSEALKALCRKFNARPMRMEYQARYETMMKKRINITIAANKESYVIFNQFIGS